MMKKVLAFLTASSVFVSGYGFTGFSADEETSKYFLDRISFYESFNMRDPQVFKDEDFFGKWDGESWEIEPAFDYERYPELSEIEDAAKSGNYDAAKEETLDYYRQRFADDKYEQTTAYTSKSDRLVGEMVMENTMLRTANLFPMEKLTLTAGKEEWFEADLTKRVISRIATANSTRFNIRIHDVKKDGYMAKFWTKESGEEPYDSPEKRGKTPYVTAIVNGAPRTYYPIADNTVRADDDAPSGPNGKSYFDVSYSDEQYMYANESYTSIGTQKPIDDYTRRACLLFDFSDISINDTITSVKFFVYGTMVEDDNPVRPMETKTSMNVFVLDDAQNLNWMEDGHCWSKQSQDDCFSYDGEYGPNITIPTAQSGQWSAFVMHQQYLVNTLTALYRGTGEEAYAYHAIRLSINSAHILRDDFTQVTQYFMQLATRNDYLVTNLYTLIKSEYMTPEYFIVLLKLLHMQNDFLVEGWTGTDEANNIGSITTAGLLKGAMTFREFKRYSEPRTEPANPQWGGSVQGGWRDVGIYRSIYMLNKTINDDGSCIEIPLGYLMTCVNSFFDSYDWADEIGIGEEIVQYISDEEKELLRKIAYYVINMQNPIKGVWQIGDDNKYIASKSPRMCGIVKFFGINDDPVIEWGYSKGARESAPETTSYANDTVQKAVLRSNWTDNAVALYIDADGGEGSHAHADDLAIGVMGYGKYFLCDPLKHTYNGDEKIVNWQISTRAHNTIEINNAAQRAMETGYGLTEEPFGEELYLPSTKGEAGSLNPQTRYLGTLYDYIEGDTNGYKDSNVIDGDFEVSRSVLFVKPGYFIVTDYINPENTEKNTYKQSWHLYPGIVYETEEETKNIVSKDAQGANIIIAPVDSSNGISIQKRKGYYSTQGANTAVIVENEYVSYNKTQSGTVTYNTIIYPMTPGEKKDIRTADLPLDIDKSKANAFSAIITDKDSGLISNLSYYTLFDETEKAERKFGYYKTDATLAFTEKIQENYNKIILKNATKLCIDGGNTILENGNLIKDIGVKTENHSVEIDVKDESDIDINTFRLYCAEKIKTVSLNGRSVYFEQRGGYVYLRNTGLPEDGEMQEPPTQTTTPEHSTVSKPSTEGPSGGGGGGSITPEKNDENTSNDKEDINKQSFPDIANHWAENYIKLARERNLIEGDENGNFNPDMRITRAELITMLMRVIDGDEVIYNDSFTDINQNDWFALPISKALELGIISGDKTFRPNDYVTREEMCKMTVNVATILNGEIFTEGEFEFGDADLVSAWAIPYIKKAVSAKLMNGMENGNFAPKENSTRAQAAAVICRMTEK